MAGNTNDHKKARRRGYWAAEGRYDRENPIWLMKCASASAKLYGRFWRHLRPPSARP